MPELLFCQDRRRAAISIPWALDQATVIGSDEHSADRVITGNGLLPRHATIIKLPQSPAYVLLDHAPPGGTEVNRLGVQGFKVVRHGDQIRFGSIELTFSEFQVCTVGEGNALQEEQCLVMRHELSRGDRAVICRCGQPSHLECWLISELCARFDCSYTHRNLLVKFFQDTFFFGAITSSSPLIGSKCNNQPGYPWDGEPFGVNKTHLGRVSYCPKCKMPYHEACWLSLDICRTPDCGYNVGETVLSFFSPEKGDTDER
jgi:hypothetical protein